jgi:hypothetical protein
VRTRHWLFLASASMTGVAVAGLIALLTGPHASAQPIAGATYTGDITGCDDPPCGTVEFTVSGDGSQVEGFTAYDVPGDVCEFEGPWSYPPVPLDIEDDAFGPGILGLYEVSGSFPSEGNAEGTLRLATPDPACDSGVLDWTATTSATPTATATSSPTSTATPTTTPTATPTATPTSSPTVSPTASPTGTPGPGDLVAGWNDVCYLGPCQDIQDALAGIGQDVVAAYRLGPNGFDKWFPDRPDVSTITTLSPYEPLFLLVAGSAAWPQEPSGSPPAVASLVQGWNSVCYAGQPRDVESATQGIGGQFGALYALASNGGWQLFVPGRPDVSAPMQLGRFAAVLVLVTEPGGTQWAFDP